MENVTTVTTGRCGNRCAECHSRRDSHSKWRAGGLFFPDVDPSQAAHSAVDKEAHAVVEMFKKWRNFLIGNDFWMVMDH